MMSRCLMTCLWGQMVSIAWSGVAVPADELPGHAFFEIYSFEEGAVFGVGEGTRMYAQASLQHHQSPTGSTLQPGILAGDTEWLHERVKQVCQASRHVLRLPSWTL
ncbi:hypothetical protein WJX77_012055 [Trebouxia sp. C0004]